MYEVWKKVFLIVPKTLIDAKTMTYEIKNDFLFKYELFCFVESVNSIPNFITVTNLLLLESLRHFFLLMVLFY